MNKKVIYIFGNPLLDFDNLPLTLAPKLRKMFPKIDFIIADPNENLEPVNKELLIIDTIEGINKVTLLDDIKKIQSKKLYSLHDFDLGFNLKLFKKIGKLEKIKIIGLPMKGDRKNLIVAVSKIIKVLRFQEDPKDLHSLVKAIP